MMENEEAKQRAIDRLRNRAVDWYEKQGDPTVETTEAPGPAVPESDAPRVEMAFLLELMKLIGGSNLERKSVVLQALSNQQLKLEVGKPAEKLPELVRHLVRKEEIKFLVLALAKKYKIGKHDLTYWWGLEHA